MAPVVSRLVDEYNGKVDVKQLNVETDPAASSVASQYRVQYVPTFVFVNTDGSTAKTLVGEQSESQLKEQLDALK